MQHNVFLSLLTETGLAGMGSFCRTAGPVGLACLATLAAAECARLGPTARPVASWPCLGCYLPNGMFHEVSLFRW